MRKIIVFGITLLVSCHAFSQSSSDKDKIAELVNKSIKEQTSVVWQGATPDQKVVVCRSQEKPSGIYDLLLEKPAYFTKKKFSDEKELNNVFYTKSGKQITELEARSCEKNHKYVYALTSLGSANLDKNDRTLPYASIKVKNISWTKPMAMGDSKKQVVYLTATYDLTPSAPEQIPLMMKLWNMDSSLSKNWLLTLEKENDTWSLKSISAYK